jgi:hypothetical protein
MQFKILALILLIKKKLIFSLENLLRPDAFTDIPVTWHCSTCNQTSITSQYIIIPEIMTYEELDNQNPFPNRLRIFRLTSATRVQLSPTHFPIRSVMGAHFLGLKFKECKGEISSLSENESLYLYRDPGKRIIIYEKIYVNYVLWRQTYPPTASCYAKL